MAKNYSYKMTRSCALCRIPMWEAPEREHMVSALIRDRRASSVVSTGLLSAELLGHHIVGCARM